MNQQMYQLMTLNCGLKKEKIIGLLMKEFKLTERTAETYYYKWKREFMKMKTDNLDRALANRKPAVVNQEFEKEVEDMVKQKTPPKVKIMIDGQEIVKTETVVKEEEVKEEVKPVEVKPEPIPEHSQEEIIKALEIIKKVCNENDCDKECPFASKNGDCLVQDASPESWCIKPTTLVRFLV